MAVNQTDLSSQPAHPQLGIMIPKMTIYMKVFGILSIIGGAIYCLGIITAVLGVPFIIIGIRMRESANAFDRYGVTNAFPDLYEATERQMRFFFIQYILAIIGIVLSVLFIIAYIIFIIVAISGGLD